jgi:hypothetical protein
MCRPPSLWRKHRSKSGPIKREGTCGERESVVRLSLRDMIELVTFRKAHPFAYGIHNKRCNKVIAPCFAIIRL